jgi:3-oxoacyl-[acyl-carrier protein] reductase
MTGLEGMTALVTGASRGIGAAIARLLASEGAAVAVVDVNIDGARSVVAQIEREGGKAMALVCDIRDPAAIGAMFDEIEAQYGPVSILVNNAARHAFVRLEDIDPDHFHAIFGTVMGTALVTGEFARRFRSDGGRVVNISSGSARNATVNQSIYAASKAAIEAMTRCYALELGDRKITVNAVAPGPANTAMIEKDNPDEESRKRLISKIAFGRLGEPEDIARVVAFLCSAEGGWVTCQVIDANGGYNLVRPPAN